MRKIVDGDMAARIESIDEILENKFSKMKRYFVLSWTVFSVISVVLWLYDMVVVIFVLSSVIVFVLLLPFYFKMMEIDLRCRHLERVLYLGGGEDL